MRTLGSGMGGMTHENDIRIAEGLQHMSLPDNPAEAMAAWRGAVNEAVTNWHRARDCDFPDLNDLERRRVIDPIGFCFPHYFILPQYSSASSYRIRPLGPEQTLFEVWSLTRYPNDRSPGKPTPPEPLAPDDPSWPMIPAQDFSNLPKQQKGLHAKGFEYMRLSDQIEGLISNFERVIDGFLAGLPYERLVPAIQKTNTTIDVPVADLGLTETGPGMMNWDKSVDLLIAGSGGGGMVAALAALDSGIEPLVVEKQALVGGSTGMSGGMVWLPNNPLMRADGIPDSHEDGLAYFDDVVGDIGAASSPARREMFLTAGFEMIDFLLRKGVRLVRCPGYSDYYPNHKGGNAAGRSVEGIPYDAAALGDWSDKVQPSMAKNYGFVVKTNELRVGAVLQPVAARVRRRDASVPAHQDRQAPASRDLMTNGASFIGQMLKVLIDLAASRRSGRTPRWTTSSSRTAASSAPESTATAPSLNVQARKGVLLAAGGFSRNADMRRRYSGDQPNEGKWSIANAGDTGEVLQTAMNLGAQDRPAGRGLVATNGFHRRPGCARRSDPGGSAPAPSTSTGPASGSATSRTPTSRSARRCTPTRRCRAGRSSTRATSAGTSSGANPFKKRTLSEALIEQGAVKRADTIADLARQIDVPADALEETVKRFNEFAAKGLDPDFGRGQSAYNDCLGDPGYKPNAALGPLDRAPYYATRVFPADVGTCGGVITNEHAQVLDEHDQVIDGLYATGNITATVMGRTYLGAGGSIANTMMFGYVAARHAAGR